MDTNLEADYFLKEFQSRLDEEMHKLQHIKEKMQGKSPDQLSGNLAMLEYGLQQMIETLLLIRGDISAYERSKRIRDCFKIKEISDLFSYVGVN